MNFRPCGWVLFACLPALASVASAGLQTNSSPSDTGIESPWDVRTTLIDILKQADRLRPVLTQLDPQQWSDKKGASSVYIVQRTTAQHQLNDLTTAANLFSQKTESLPLGLDLYFRLEALDVTARSLDEGAKQYAARVQSDKLAQLIAADFTSREKLQTYLRDLSKTAEENFKIADAEAQRCRATISSEAPAHSQEKKKR